MNFGRLSTNGDLDLPPASCNTGQLALLRENPGDGGVVSVLSRRDSLKSQHGVQVGLVLVPSWKSLKDTGNVCRGDCLVLADHQKLSWCVLLGHGQSTGGEEGKANGGAEHFGWFL